MLLVRLQRSQKIEQKICRRLNLKQKIMMMQNGLISGVLLTMLSAASNSSLKNQGRLMSDSFSHSLE
jgi:flagellar biosynthesis/type III secretory pathway chaperone